MRRCKHSNAKVSTIKSIELESGVTLTTDSYVMWLCDDCGSCQIKPARH